jgi:NAD(P)-dependent dehydrogenase (short-subunit alcohol dehydrogenase family)
MFTQYVNLRSGGTRGIGQQMALALAKAGADIILLQVRYVSLRMRQAAV